MNFIPLCDSWCQGFDILLQTGDNLGHFYLMLKGDNLGHFYLTGDSLRHFYLMGDNTFKWESLSKVDTILKDLLRKNK